MGNIVAAGWQGGNAGCLQATVWEPVQSLRASGDLAL